MKENYDDIELIHLAKNGDKEAFNKLIEKYSQRVYNLCYRLTGNKFDADDIFQETFIRAYKSIKRFKGESDFGTWLYRIAMNLWISEKRKSARKKIVSFDREIEVEDGEIQVEYVDPEESVEEDVQEQQIQDLVQEQIVQLNADCQLIIILRYIEGKSYKEIARICKCSIGTVGSRIYRAFQILRKNLLPLLDEIYGKNI
ncbi:MAG: sigma-70 family RNA polymerase sigma factor [Endomicrobia bacterium]|nr:sigma-70 family RNA polymerase sigma factor [Endomicrobiia bacterium]